MAQLEAAADQLVPPLSMAVGATVGAGIASHALLRLARTPLARLNAALSIGLLLAQAAHVLAGLRMVRAPRSVYRSLVYAPLMVAWKLPLLAQVALFGRAVRWTRTARNDEDPAEPTPPVSPPAQPGPLTVMVGVPVDDVTLEEAVERCGELVEIGRATGQTHQVTTVNVDFLLTAGRHPSVRKILQSSDLAIPDGMPVVWGSRLLGTRLRQRVAGADLVPALAECAARRGYRIYLFGSAPGVAEEAAELLSKEHPGAMIVGAGGPMFADVEDMDRAALDDIIAARPDIVCVALGHPKQERWIEAYRHEIGAPLMVGVGGSLDFIVGRKRRAPAWMQRTGLEWLHRMLTEPGRLGRRYARDLLIFPPLLLREVIKTPSRTPAACTLERSGVVEDGGSMIVDLQPIAHLDRVTLASLIQLARRARANGGELSLVGVSGHARRTLRALRVDSCFRMPADVEMGAEGDELAFAIPHGDRRPRPAAAALTLHVSPTTSGGHFEVACVVYSVSPSRHAADRTIARSPPEVTVSRQFVLRLLETFFRRWVLYLVPIVVFLGLGFMSVTNTKDVYASTGVVYVDDETLLAALTGVGGAERPVLGRRQHQVVSEQMSSAFQTEGLVRSMAEEAGMTTALEDGTATIGSLRGSLSFAPSGSNLVHVRASTAEPRGVIPVGHGCRRELHRLRGRGQPERERLRRGVPRRARAAVRRRGGGRERGPQLLPSIPSQTLPSATRPAVEQAAIDRLRSAVDTANVRHTDALDKLENARLATAQTRADVSQRLQLVDEPQTPSAPQGSMRAKAITMAMFGSLGFLLCAAAVLAGTLIDRSIRTAADVTERLRTVALASLPEAPHMPSFEQAPDSIPRHVVARS